MQSVLIFFFFLQVRDIDAQVYIRKLPWSLAVLVLLSLPKENKADRQPSFQCAWKKIVKQGICLADLKKKKNPQGPSSSWLSYSMKVKKRVFALPSLLLCSENVNIIKAETFLRFYLSNTIHIPFASIPLTPITVLCSVFGLDARHDSVNLPLNLLSLVNLFA